MADQFDAVDIIYDIIKDCSLKGKVYKDKAPTKTVTGKIDHVVVSPLTNVEDDYINKIPVNVNGYFKKDSSGMIRRSVMKAFKKEIDKLIKEAAKPIGFYCIIERSLSNNFTDLDNGFDCVNIRFVLTLNS